VRRQLADDEGQAIVVIALSIAALLLGIGLALDTGQLFVSRRGMQTAADAAAWAGASVLFAGGNATAARSAAVLDASRNGFAADADTTITTASPPTSGVAAGDSGSIEVTVSQLVHTILLRGASGGGTIVSVRSVAGNARSGDGDAVVVLNSSSSSTLSLAGGARLTIVGGGSATNSTSNTAVSIASGGQLTGTYHRVTGNVSGPNAGRMSPAPTVGVAATADPFAALSGPSTTGLALYSGQTISSGTVTLNPGVYSGLVTVGNNGIANLNPGLYIFQAGIRTTNNGSILPGTTGAVLIYNTYSNYPSAPGGSPVCGSISLAGTGQLKLAASRSGPYAGMVIFQDRNCATGAAITVRAATSFGGSAYLPAALLTITLATDTAMSSQFVVKTLTVTGAFTLTLNFTPGSVTGRRVPSLLE
jgi:hypothetical protein